MRISDFIGLDEILRALSFYGELKIVFAIIFGLLAINFIAITYAILPKTTGKGGRFTWGILAICLSLFLTFYSLEYANTFTDDDKITMASLEVVGHETGVREEYQYFTLILKAIEFPVEHADQWKMTRGNGNRLEVEVSEQDYNQIKEGTLIAITYKAGRYFPYDVQFRDQTGIHIDVPVEQAPQEPTPETPVESETPSTDETNIEESQAPENLPESVEDHAVVPHESLQTPEPTPLDESKPAPQHSEEVPKNETPTEPKAEETPKEEVPQEQAPEETPHLR
jgi:hypothetical protein